MPLRQFGDGLKTHVDVAIGTLKVIIELSLAPSPEAAITRIDDNNGGGEMVSHGDKRVVLP